MSVDVAAAPQKGKKSALGLRKRKRVGIRIDMTPMVDLAFLLLIFFMVTTVFRRPLAMEVNVPEPGAKVEVPVSNVMTAYVMADGTIEYDVGQRGLAEASWEELRDILVLELDYNPDLIVLVKVDRSARYERMVDVLDALYEARISRFSVIPMTEADKAVIGAQ